MSGENEEKKRPSKALLSTIDFQGFHAKPSFFKSLVNSIANGRLANIVTLSLTNCGIQDTEGQSICKVVIMGRLTPQLRSLVL